MNKKEMQTKCDYDLISIYQNGNNQEKKDASEVMYMRYQPLTYKIGMKYCQYTGVSNLEDFQQEAYFELVRVLNSIKLNKISSEWKIVKVYKQRLQNMMKLMKKREIKQTNHICNSYISDKNRTKIEVKSSPFKSTDMYDYQIDYIQGCCDDNKSLEVNQKNKEMKQLYYFIDEYLAKSRKNEKTCNHWFREVLKLIIFTGMSKLDACKAVGVSHTRYYQVVNNNRKYNKNQKSLKEKWEKFQRECKEVLY